MPEKNFTTLVRNMVLSKKLIAIGALLLALSCFLPWFSDIDRFNTGNTYLGVSGPLYLAGLITFLCASTSIFIICFELLGHKIQKFPLSSQQIHLTAISISILMILLTSSVYFHPKFGVNIANKQIGFGMILSIISLISMMIGTFLALKKKMDKEDLLERHHESLRTLGLEDSLKKDLSTPSFLDNIEDERFSYFSNETSINNNQEK